MAKQNTSQAPSLKGRVFFSLTYNGVGGQESAVHCDGVGRAPASPVLVACFAAHY